jgi:hypothetical protein
VLVFLRFVSVTNAALWFGAVVFFIFAVRPTFYAGSIFKIVPMSHSVAVAHLVLDRFYWWQYGCGVIAVIHLVAEWLYAGKSLQRGIFYVVMGLWILTLFGGFVVQPKLHQAHRDAYGLNSTAPQRSQGGKMFELWNAVSKTVNILSAVGLLVYVWQITTPGSSPRFVGGAKFRG